MTRETSGRRGIADGTLWAGLLLIVAGTVLVLHNLDVLDARVLWTGWWPALVIGAGVWLLVGGQAVVGTVVAGIGALLLLDLQQVIEVNVGQLIWPGLLILVGGGLLRAGLQVRGFETGPAGNQGATAVFGDARLRLDDTGRERAEIPVTATAVFGDVTVEVPAGWRVRDRLTRLLGDVSIPTDQPGYPEAPLVVLHGLVMLGDVNVRYLDVTEVS